MKNQAHNIKTTKFRSSVIAVAMISVASFTWWLTSSEAFAPNIPISSLPNTQVVEQPEFQSIKQEIQQLERDQYQEIETTVQSGDTLTHIFERHNLKTADLYEILQLKQFKSQLTQLHLKQKIVILHTSQGNVVDLTLQLGKDKELQVYKNDFGFDAEILQGGEPVLTSLAQHSIVTEPQTISNSNVATTATALAVTTVVTKAVKKAPKFKSNRLELKIKSGDTLYKFFRQHKLNLADLERILKLSRKSRRQLQNLKINQKLVITRTKNNHVKSLSLAIGKKATLHFTQKGNNFKGEIEKNGTRVALNHKPKPRLRVAKQTENKKAKKVAAKKPARTIVKSYAPLKAPSPQLGDMIKSAKKYLGYPYVYGGTTPRGFDCSGFVVYNSKKAGISYVPRTAHQQYKHTATTPVSRKNLKPGDLVFFHSRNNRKRIGHVGIYIGDDKFIHARAKGPKDVTITSLNNSYYRKHFVRGGRL
ncbi:NlpC/P60 family protein [Candidatus Albibeggiatoa sp. nov. BB20]|uniref:NlpC/P60 family protein n=1 Tax=Candidatus Albibeggiatoa sp. nov. BB20 TaxID=3162723 RepID=UPI003365AD1A